MFDLDEFACHPCGGAMLIFSGCIVHATETGISSGLMGRLARMQTLPFTYVGFAFLIMPHSHQPN